MTVQCVSQALVVLGLALFPAAPREAVPRVPELARVHAALTRADSNQIQAGEERSGTLSSADANYGDGTFYQDWKYAGKKGERLTITLRSEEFDAYLRFGQLKGGEFSQIVARDNGAGGNDSLVQVTLPAEGEYVIRVNTFLEGTGAFKLKVESRR